MSYRPITDIWILGRPKVRYYGAYPCGFLHRARALLGVGPADPVLHVCGGKVREYPGRGCKPGQIMPGWGANDKTVDIDPELNPDFCGDVRNLKVVMADMPVWPAILADPPYSASDAEHYRLGAGNLPDPGKLLRDCIDLVPPGGRVGMLHYILPQPPKHARFVACIGVVTGFRNRMRVYSVFEKGQK